MTVSKFVRCGLCSSRPWRWRRSARKRRGIHQHPHRRHRRRLLSARRRDVENLRREDCRRQAVGAIDQGLGRKPQFAASRQGRDRLHARRFARRRLERQRRSRLQEPSSTSCARSPRSIRTTSRSPRSRMPTSTRSPISRASGCRSARRNRAPNSTRARSWPAPACRTRISARCEYLPFSESVELMKNRQLDATLISAGLGVSAIRDLCVSVDCAIVETPKSVVAKIGSPYQSAVIPGGTYKGNDKDVEAASCRTIWSPAPDCPTRKSTR